MTELKPCPFCGDGIYKEKNVRGDALVFHYCNVVGVLFITNREAWNTREIWTCNLIHEEHIVDDGEFDAYTCDFCAEYFAMFGGVKPHYCPRCGAKVVE